ncbi:29689_t:CDS:2 [Gigaspora margarita]|uniref:29689_t:CDS:1 n=1 Tax=Gigaspora margarita TaxID=4874 RepID=A0ABN7V306_GIGMA|nr:29689_t:CDS:2 [Gigaspora margarita]
MDDIDRTCAIGHYYEKENAVDVEKDKINSSNNSNERNNFKFGHGKGVGVTKEEKMAFE